MTPDELYAKGYSLEWQAWGVRVHYDEPAFIAAGGITGDAVLFGKEERLTSTPTVTFIVSFDRPLKEAEAIKRGWEAAELDLVKRRLEI